MEIESLAEKKFMKITRKFGENLPEPVLSSFIITKLNF